MIGVLIFFCFAAWLTFVCMRGRRGRPKNYPPGPWGFPILGHLPLLGLEPYKKATVWKQKYGPIVAIDFASVPCIVISDYKLSKEAFANPAFAGRPNLRITKSRSGGRPEGIIMSSGATWREQRTFAHRRLRELGGFGTRSMEGIIMEQVQELVQELQQNAISHTPVKMKHLFNLPVLNALWTIMTGEPLPRNDPNVARLALAAVQASSEVNVMTMLSMFMPWFSDNFPTWLTRADALDEIFVNMQRLFQPIIDQHWRTHTQGEPRDFIDTYIDEIKGTDDPESSFHSSRSKYSLITALIDLYLGGVDTTGTQLEWIFLVLAKFPHVQQKVADEIATVMGSHRLPSLNDRPSMPYTEAVLHEVMRHRVLVPWSVFHATTEDVHFHGFDIPKDTMVYVNNYDAHFDAEIWGDPQVFRPERWLSPDGKEFVRQREGFLAFSSGKRACLGEQLARDELFLFTTRLLQVFQFGVEPNGPEPTLEPKLGGSSWAPYPHRLVLTLRQE